MKRLMRILSIINVIIGIIGIIIFILVVIDGKSPLSWIWTVILSALLIITGMINYFDNKE